MWRATFHVLCLFAQFAERAQASPKLNIGITGSYWRCDILCSRANGGNDERTIIDRPLIIRGAVGVFLLESGVNYYVVPPIRSRYGTRDTPVASVRIGYTRTFNHLLTNA